MKKGFTFKKLVALYFVALFIGCMLYFIYHDGWTAEGFGNGISIFLLLSLLSLMGAGGLHESTQPLYTKDINKDKDERALINEIEKATGNMVSANYTLPMIMSVKAMGVNAQIGMTFIDDYSIAY